MAIIKCPHCSSQTEINSNGFCSNCGKQLFQTEFSIKINTVKCPFCAEEISSEAIKCKHCGEFLDSSIQEQRVRENARITRNETLKPVNRFSNIFGGIYLIFQGLGALLFLTIKTDGTIQLIFVSLGLISILIGIIAVIKGVFKK